MVENANTKPDAFKAVIAASQREQNRPELAHQSLGRPLSPEEDALADALMEIYASGEAGADAVAAALVRKGVPSPRSGSADWTPDSLAAELAALNADLDNAYDENGFGG